MVFLFRVLSGLGAEFRSTVGVWALLKPRFWIVYILLILATLTVAVLPGVAAPIGAGGMVLALGLGGIFSGTVAKRLRRGGWVSYADGPEVVPYLPQAVAILLGPPFFLALASLFHALAPYLEGFQGATTWPMALALAIDNFLHTQLFFDFFECYGLRLAAKPTGIVASTLILILRTLLDVAFIKLAVQFIRAAYFRALDFGRGGDLINQTREACENEDIGAVRLHSREVGQSVRAAVEDLRLHYEAGGTQAEQAWMGLRAMKAFALNHFEDRVETQLGDERTRTQRLAEQLAGDEGPGPAPHPIPWWGFAVLGVVYALLMAVTYLAADAPASSSWPLSITLVLLFGWFLIAPRAWLDRLDTWGVLPAGSPAWMPFRILLWLAFLTPLFIVAGAEVLVLVGRAYPSAFGLSSPETVTGAGALGFVVENLLRTQIFVDTVEIYDLEIYKWHQQGFLGSTLTFLLRLTFNIGLLAVLVPFFLEQFNRLFRGLKTRPDAELLLRREARACGPHSALLVSYYFDQVRDWFVEAMSRHQDNAATLGALATSGFVSDFQQRYPESPRPSEDPSQDIGRRLERGQSLIFEGMLSEGEQEIRRAIEALERLQQSGREDLDDLAAFARYVSGNLAMIKGNMPEAEARLREAMAMIDQLGGNELGSPLTARLADLYDSLAIVVGQTVARAPEALGYAQKSVDLFRHLIADGQPDYRESLANSLGTRGQMLNQMQRWDEAVESLGRAIDTLEEIQSEHVKAQELLASALFSGTTTRVADVRQSLAQRRLELAEVYRELRRFPDAVREGREAINLLEALIREGQSGARTQLARALNLVGLALNDERKLDEAQPHFDRARELCETLILEGHGSQRQLLAPLLNNLGLLLNEKGESVAAEKHFRRAIELIDRLIEEGQTQRQELLVFVYSNLASSLMRQKQMHAAEEEVTRAVELGQRLVGQGQATLRDELALVLHNLGDLLTHKYQWERAVAAFRESAHWYGELVEGGARQYRPLQARALERLSASLRLFGELDEAEQAGRQAVDLFSDLVKSGKTEHRGEVAATLRTLGLAHHANRNFDEALARFDEAATFVASDSSDDQLTRATLLVDTAATYEQQERHTEAILTLDRAILTQARLVDSGRKDLVIDVALLLNHRGNLLYNTGDFESALTAYREAIRRMQPLVDSGNRAQRQNLATFQANRAATLIALKEPGWDEAHRASLALTAELVREGDPGPTDGYFPQVEAFAERLREQGREAEAEAVLREVIDTCVAAYAADPRNLRAQMTEVQAHQALALFLADQGKPTEFLGKADTTLTLLEGLLRLPDPPERALRFHREATIAFVRRLGALPATEEAGKIARRSLQFLKDLDSQGRGGLTGSLVDLLELNAEVHEQRGEFAEAIVQLSQAQEMMAADPFDAYSLSAPAPRLFRLLRETGREEEALTLANTAIHALQTELGEEPDAEQGYEARTLAAWYRLRAGLELARGERAAANESLRRALALFEISIGQTANIAGVWQDLLTLNPEATTLDEIRTFIVDLGQPMKYPQEAITAVRSLVEQAAHLRPEDLTWIDLRNRWKA